jgi:hypothetical protein
MRALLIGYLQQAARGEKAHRPVVDGKVGLQSFWHPAHPCSIRTASGPGLGRREAAGNNSSNGMTNAAEVCKTFSCSPRFGECTVSSLFGGK